MTVEEELKERLKTYPGPHPGEKWKLETDLTRCTPREKLKMREMGTDPQKLMAAGLNRGEVAHILFGWQYVRKGAGIC